MIPKISSIFKPVESKGIWHLEKTFSKLISDPTTTLIIERRLSWRGKSTFTVNPTRYYSGGNRFSGFQLKPPNITHPRFQNWHGTATAPLENTFLEWSLSPLFLASSLEFPHFLTQHNFTNISTCQFLVFGVSVPKTVRKTRLGKVTLTSAIFRADASWVMICNCEPENLGMYYAKVRQSNYKLIRFV